MRTRADADVVSPSTPTRDIALASGAQIVHTDFPPGESQLGTGYVVSFGTRVSARCNPVLTTRGDLHRRGGRRAQLSPMRRASRQGDGLTVDEANLVRNCGLPQA